MSLTDLDRCKTSLGIPAGVTFHDGALQLAVDYANSRVLDAIGQPGGLVATTRTDYPEVYNANQQDVLLDRAPVVSIVAITNAEDAVNDGEYRVDKESGKLRLLRGHVGTRRVLASWSDVPDDVVVTYLHGYTEATVPPMLKRTADMIATHNGRQVLNAGVKAERNSTRRIDMSEQEMPREAAAILAQYTDVFHT